MERFTIVGAGLAGLLAGAMLRGQAAAILERQNDIPNNHSAVLRFRSSVVGDAAGIPFKKVRVLKAALGWRNPVADAMAYSKKTNGSYTLRSVVSATGEVSDRYIAPADFVSQMYGQCSGIPFHFGRSAVTDIMDGQGPVIWTGPLNILAEDIGLIDGEMARTFRHVPGINVKFDVAGLDAYASLYVPDPMFRMARISITGSEVVAECYGSDDIRAISHSDIVRDTCYLLGIDPNEAGPAEARVQRYAKILPIDESLRRKLIMTLSREHSIYCLGRFATWRPGLLMDDLVNDVRVIQRLAASHTEVYTQRKKED